MFLEKSIPVLNLFEMLIQIIIFIFLKFGKKNEMILVDDCLQPLTWWQTLAVQLHTDWQPCPYIGKGHLMSHLVPINPFGQTKQKLKTIRNKCNFLRKKNTVKCSQLHCTSPLLYITYVCISSSHLYPSQHMVPFSL